MENKNENLLNIYHINLGGIGFEANMPSLKMRKTYGLKLKTLLMKKDVETDVKISIIEMQKYHSGRRECRAVYRKLTDEQLTKLGEIADAYDEGEIVLAFIE